MKFKESLLPMGLVWATAFSALASEKDANRFDGDYLLQSRAGSAAILTCKRPDGSAFCDWQPRELDLDRLCADSIRVSAREGWITFDGVSRARGETLVLEDRNHSYPESRISLDALTSWLFGDEYFIAMRSEDGTVENESSIHRHYAFASVLSLGDDQIELRVVNRSERAYGASPESIAFDANLLCRYSRK